MLKPCTLSANSLHCVSTKEHLSQCFSTQLISSSPTHRLIRIRIRTQSDKLISLQTAISHSSSHPRNPLAYELTPAEQRCAWAPPDLLDQAPWFRGRVTNPYPFDLRVFDHSTSDQSKTTHHLLQPVKVAALTALAHLRGRAGCAAILGSWPVLVQRHSTI